MDHTIFNERPESQNRMIKMLEKMGYEYVSRSEAEIKRGSLTKVVFEDELIRFLKKQQYRYGEIDYNFSAENIAKAVRALDASLLQGLTMASKEIYSLLINGISLPETLMIGDNNFITQSFDLNYIDFEHVENNTWQVTDEFQVERNVMGIEEGSSRYARPDIVLLCNGIPIVIIECKKSAVDVNDGVVQNVRNMRPEYIPHLYKYAQLVLAVNPNKVLYGTCGTTVDYFVEWREREIDWQQRLCEKYINNDKQIIVQDRMTVSLLDRCRLLDFISSYILYDCNIKKIARHQQYFAVKRTMERIKGLDNKGTRSGVIWHTQGSGKSLTMVMLVKKILADKSIKSPRFILVTDRVNLDKQIRDNFANTSMKPCRASTGKGLKALIEDKGKIVITTLIHKFESVVRQKVVAPDSENIFVLIDEAHRSNYNALYNYMRDVLPNSTFIAFTGTPLLSDNAKNLRQKANKKKDTYKKFGPLIDSYTMEKAVEDGVTVPLVYEGRKIEQQKPGKIIDNYFESLTQDLPAKMQEELRHKWSRYKQIAETSGRLSVVAFDVAEHMKEYCLPKGLKGMLVCSSRMACCEVFDALKSIKDIHPAVIISFGDKPEGDDDVNTTLAKEKINKYFNSYVKPLFGDNVDAYDDSMINRFKDEDGDINLLIVKNKLLTGFDAPIAGVLYLDKSIQQHTLLQAIARVNRIYKGKDFGLIVDYYGVFKKLKTAMDMYDDTESGFNNFDKEDINDYIYGPIDEAKELERAYNLLKEIFIGLDSSSSSNEWQERLSDEKVRKDFYEKFSKFARQLDFVLSNRSIYVEVGFERLNILKQEFLFFKKLKNAVVERYNEVEHFERYEDGIRSLLNTFVTANGVELVVKPVSILDVEGMKKVLEKMGSDEAKADAIKTRTVAELKQKRYDDPILFEEFSERIKKTLEQYDEERNIESYLKDMEIIADDLRNNRMSVVYPNMIREDSDAKAFYGAIINKLENIIAEIDSAKEILIAETAVSIKSVISANAKRDWKDNPVVHKLIHNGLDDCLFDLFEKLNLDYNQEKILNVLDIIIDNIMRVALTRY